jgi:hypothetical protein
MPTGTVTWEGVIGLWSGANVSFYNWTRDVQGRVGDNRTALYRIESGAEVKVPHATLDQVRQNASMIGSMGASLNVALVDASSGQPKLDKLAAQVTNVGDVNPALTELRGGVSATVSGLSGLTSLVQAELHPSGGSSKVDDIIARLQRIEDKVDALAAP